MKTLLLNKLWMRPRIELSRCRSMSSLRKLRRAKAWHIQDTRPLRKITKWLLVIFLISKWLMVKWSLEKKQLWTSNLQTKTAIKTRSKTALITKCSVVIVSICSPSTSPESQALVPALKHSLMVTGMMMAQWSYLKIRKIMIFINLTMN